MPLTNKNAVEPWFEMVQNFQKKAIAAKNQANELMNLIKSKDEQTAERMNNYEKRLQLKDAEITDLKKTIDDLKKTIESKEAEAGDCKKKYETQLQIKDDEIIDLKKCIETIKPKDAEISANDISDSNSGSQSAEIARDTKRFSCSECNDYFHETKSKITAHQKRGCKATKHMLIKDHQCPLCNEISDYDGMRMHFNHYISNDGFYIDGSETPHSKKDLNFHIDMKAKMMNAKSEAKKSGVQYMPFYPIQNRS